MKSMIAGVVLGMALTGTANALTTFVNGEKADANAVNDNFTELDNKISSANTTISNLKTQLGNLQNQINSLSGALVQTYDAADYVTTATQKVFSVKTTSSYASSDTVYQSFGTYNGKTLMYNNAYSAGTRTGVSVITFSLDATGYQRESIQVLDLAVVGNKYDPAAGPINVAPPLDTEVYDTLVWAPSILNMAKTMEVGRSWGTGSDQTLTFVAGVPNWSGFTLVSTLLAVEDVTLPYVSVNGAAPVNIAYTGCLKIADQRAATTLTQSISWYCPGGVGLVKRISATPVGGTSTALDTTLMELTSIQ